MKIPGIAEQIAAMRCDWPAFELVMKDGESATWRGAISPTTIAYTVEVRYRVPLVIENTTVRDAQPRVTVDGLASYRWHPAVDELHLYWPTDRDESPPVLCLFDPYAHPCQWSVERLLAETTLPWTCEWLLFFEGWLVTGTWEGGGRHPTAPLAA